MRNRLVVALVVGALFVSVPLAAHHTGATLYSDETVTLKGIVKAWLWSNPHCLLTFEVTGEDGQVVQWLAETQAPNNIYRSGYRKSSFKPGDEVTVTLEPVTNGQPFGRLARVVLADGTTLPEGGGRGGGTAQ